MYTVISFPHCWLNFISFLIGYHIKKKCNQLQLDTQIYNEKNAFKQQTKLTQENQSGSFLKKQTKTEILEFYPQN